MTSLDPWLCDTSVTISPRLFLCRLGGQSCPIVVGIPVAVTLCMACPCNDAWCRFYSENNTHHNTNLRPGEATYCHGCRPIRCEGPYVSQCQAHAPQTLPPEWSMSSHLVACRCSTSLFKDMSSSDRKVRSIFCSTSWTMIETSGDRVVHKGNKPGGTSRRVASIQRTHRWQANLPGTWKHRQSGGRIKRDHITVMSRYRTIGSSFGRSEKQSNWSLLFVVTV